MTSRAKAMRRRLARTAAVCVLTALLTAVAASPASAALAVSLSAAPTATRGGGTVVFTATVTNNGAAAISLHVLIVMEGSERTGGEFLYLSSGEGSGLDCSLTAYASMRANCFGSGLGPGQSAHISVTTAAQAEGSGGPVVVTATFEGSDGSRESAQTTVTVAGEPEEEGSGGSRRGSSPSGGAGQPTGGEGQPTGGSKTLACVVPKLTGRALASAKKLLAKAHCKLGKVTKKKSKGKVGVVVSQKPKAGSRLKAGSAIAVVLRRH
jgi:hypothetical protein